jgi:hypothetical protein
VPIMIRPALKGALLVVLGACLLTGCGLFGPKVETEAYETADGAIVVQSVELVASIEAINARTREVTVNPKYGRSRVVKVHEGVDLAKIRVGDEVHIELVEAIAVSLIAGGAPESAGELAAVALAPVGDKPAITAVDTRELTATIVGIDGGDHELTLEWVDGSTDPIKVSKKIDLSQLSLGDSVRIQVTDAVAIAVVTPGG